MSKEAYETPVLKRVGQIYTGPIVGGSMAGKKLTSGSKSYTHRAWPKVDLFTGESAMSDLNVTTERYVYTEIMYPDGDDVAVLTFWRIDTLADAKAAMEHVFAGYVKSVQN